MRHVGSDFMTFLSRGRLPDETAAQGKAKKNKEKKSSDPLPPQRRAPTEGVSRNIAGILSKSFTV